ncbi:hypothetical protein GCM10009584_27530 [Ornithinimicrobium humiphilum]|uniref:Uncharacterized protein n=1 Tax=Ornithinimicrobium humiphilum TaxID=125288 RepID=A0A543KP23_9MICO|nr:DUF6226 family protein [Ornithinimicrobium humiphilum]TQM96828.1 hypothetical protein FB476_1720 [Ornithinimicrobium humiphilum]
MTGLGDLSAEVAARYARLDLPSWPNPHPDGAEAREEEYSRVTAPERYRIVHARARVWIDVLTDLLDVDTVPLPAAPLDGTEPSQGSFDRGTKLVPRRPDTLPLLLLERDAPQPGHQSTLAVLHISAAEPRITLMSVPDCGCDACDWGSEDLLDAIDDTVGRVVGGPFVALLGQGWFAQWHPDGGASGGTRSDTPHDTLLDWCRRAATGERGHLPDGVEVHVGRSWLD